MAVVESAPSRRVNGFSKPFNILQGASWFLFLVFIATF
jgi:hypothetical protein